MIPPSVDNQKNRNLTNYLLGTCLILAFVIRFARTVMSFYDDDPFRTFGYTEFMINFQGGFVRRGLFGELLYQFYNACPLSVIAVISAISYAAFFAVIIYFFYKFYKQKYCWWILLSPLFLGFTYYIVRKDNILYCILIGALYLLGGANPSALKRMFACLLITLGLFLHEAFIFWGFPIYALLLLARRHHRPLNYIFISIPFAIFILLSVCKGTEEIQYQIVDSWNSTLPGSPLNYEGSNSIGALAWEARHTFLSHWNENINVSHGGYGAILIPLYILVAYYMFTNFLYVFNKQSEQEDKDRRLAISLVYSLLAICMIPMFTVLSCDIGRNFQYLSVATFATFLIIPYNNIILAFPEWYKRLIIKFNAYINRILKPNKAIILSMLLFLGMSPCSFSIVTCMSYSVVGTLIGSIFRPFVI